MLTFRKYSMLRQHYMRNMEIYGVRSINTDIHGHHSANEADNAQPMDAYTKEFYENRIELTTLQRIILTTGSAIAALVDPRRHDMIACLGETTGNSALRNIRETMNASAEGRRILTERPRINTTTVNIDKLRSMPANTFGHTYVNFLDTNKVTPDSRMEVRFINDPELSYIMTRYRECHDLVHTVLDMPTNMLGEVSVKWMEALNNGLPMCYGGAIFGAFRLRPKQRQEYMSRYLPWAVRNGIHMKPFMAIYWEERWEQDIDDLRQELGVTPLN